MYKSAINFFVFIVPLINGDINSMNKRSNNDDSCYFWYNDMRDVSSRELNGTHIGPQAKKIASQIIKDVGIYYVVRDEHFYSKSDKAEEAIQSWCKENPATCTQMKALLPYALRYESVKEIEKLHKEVEFLKSKADDSYRKSQKWNWVCFEDHH